MRRGGIALAMCGLLALGGCAAGADADPAADRSGPATLAPDDLGTDVVDLAVVQDQIDDLRQGLGDADDDVRARAEAALDQAQAALDRAGPAREDGTQSDKDAAVGAVEGAVEALDAARAQSPDAFGRALDVLNGQLRRLAEELRRAPG